MGTFNRLVGSDESGNLPKIVTDKIIASIPKAKIADIEGLQAALNSKTGSTEVTQLGMDSDLNSVVTDGTRFAVGTNTMATAILNSPVECPYYGVVMSYSGVTYQTVYAANESDTDPVHVYVRRLFAETGKWSAWVKIFPVATGVTSYNSLTDKPTLGTAAAMNTGTTGTTVALGNHNHDERYFTETEISNKLMGFASSTHDHAGVYASVDHNHNDLYYTQQQVDSKIVASQHGGVAPTWDSITGKPTFGVAATMNTGTTGNTVALGNHTHSGYAAASHNHDAIYYTKGQIDTTVSGLQPKTDMTVYAKTTDLANCVQASTLTNYAQKSELAGFLTIATASSTYQPKVVPEEFLIATTGGFGETGASPIRGFRAGNMVTIHGQFSGFKSGTTVATVSGENAPAYKAFGIVTTSDGAIGRCSMDPSGTLNLEELVGFSGANGSTGYALFTLDMTYLVGV